MKTDKNDNNKLTNKIIEDIEKTGFPAELEAGKILNNHFLEVNYNVYYLDEDENKGREIDLVAVDTIFNDTPDLFIEYVLVCAVKKSSKPWVIFSSEVSGIEGGGWDKITVCKNIDNNILPANKLDADSTISKFKNYGHAYHISFQNDNSAIFDALSSAVKASEQSRKMYQEWFKEDEGDISDNKVSKQDSSTQYSLALIEPIVILDGKLFEACINYKKQTTLKRINHIPVCFGYISPKYKHAEYFGNYFVEIITLDKLSRLLINKKRWLEGLKNTMVQNIMKVKKQ